MNTFELTLDLEKDQGLPQLVTLRQGDKSGTTLVATIYDHGQLVSGSYTARVSLRHPGAGDTYYRETATYSNGVATVTVDEQRAATVAGVTTGYFELLQGSTVKASTADFIVRILPSAEDGAVPGEVYDSAIEDALAELDAATGRISQMVVDATAEYLAAHPEITTTVQDNSLTDAKLIQSGGILQRERWLETMLPNITRKATSEADVHSVTDSAGGGPLGIEVYGRSTQDGTPTPDAPVAIQSVSPQLWNPAAYATLTSNGITWTPTSDGIRVSGSLTAASSYMSTVPTSTSDARLVHLTAGTYTVSNQDGASIQALLYDSAMSRTVVADWVTTQSVTFTVTGERWLFVNMRYIAQGVTVDTTDRIAVYAGTGQSAFTRHNGIGLVAVGKNLVDSDAGFWRNAGIDGSTGAYTGANAARAASNPIAVRPSTTYTLSVADGTRLAVYQYASSLAYVGSSGGWSTTSVTFTTSASTAYVRLLIANATDTNITLDSIAARHLQMERGTSATSWERHALTITIPLDGHMLRSLPDGTRDEVTVDEWGHVTLVQRVGSYTITGQESGSTAQEGSYYRFYSSVISDMQAPMQAAQGNTNGYCSHSQYAVSYTGQYVHAYVINARRFLVFSTGSNPLSDFAGAELVYPLAEPQTIDLGYIDPALLPAPDLTAYAVPSAPSVLKYGFDVAAALAEIATA